MLQTTTTHEQSFLTCINELHKSSPHDAFMLYERIANSRSQQRDGTALTWTQSYEWEPREEKTTRWYASRNDSAMHIAVTCTTAYNFRLLSGIII